MSIRTDLAIELKDTISNDLHGIISDTLQLDYNTNITRVKVVNEIGSRTIGKEIGDYVTIENEDLFFYKDYVSKIIKNELCKMLPKKEGRTLIVGLGNRFITPDAIGCETVKNTLVTRHIKEQIDFDLGDVSAITPGVLGITGIESSDIVLAVTKVVKPDVVIIIDALASRSVSKIGKTIQITNTGIAPGSGIGNKRNALNKETLNCEVIAIGVPTVVYSSTIVNDMIETMVTSGNGDSEVIKPLVNGLFYENNMVVTPKEIDEIIKKCSKVVADGINMALHNIDKETIDSLLD